MVLSSCPPLQDLKEVFSHDVLEGLGPSGASKSLIRAEAMKAARFVRAYMLLLLRALIVL